VPCCCCLCCCRSPIDFNWRLAADSYLLKFSTPKCTLILSGDAYVDLSSSGFFPAVMIFRDMVEFPVRSALFWDITRRRVVIVYRRDNVSVPASRVKSSSRKERNPATYNADSGKCSLLEIRLDVGSKKNTHRIFVEKPFRKLELGQREGYEDKLIKLGNVCLA
jgi:hypothetical protein